MAAVLAVTRFASPSTAPGSTSRPRRLARLLTLIAVAIGVVVGAWVCATGMSAGQAHHTGGTATAVSSDQPAGHHADQHVERAPDTTSTPADTDAAPTVAHPGMACLVGVDLHVRDLAVATVCDDVAPARPFLPADHPNEPDPPVPRLS